jgi:hypothetical protein
MANLGNAYSAANVLGGETAPRRAANASANAALRISVPTEVESAGGAGAAALGIRAPNPFNTPVVGSPLSTPGAENENLIRFNGVKPLTGFNASPAPTPVSRVSSTLSRMNQRNLNSLGLSANNNAYYKAHKSEVNAIYNNTSNPFAPTSLKEAINSSRKAGLKAVESQRKLEEEQARLNAEKAKLDAELEGLKDTLFQGKDYNVYNTVPITFKGDGFGYSAGFGYNFKKGKQYANFVSGFPYKYYRVYGESCDNATKKVIALRKQIEDTKEAVKRNLATKKLNRNTRLRLAKEQQAAIKEKFAQEKAAARAAANAAKKSLAAKLQQEKNASLAMMEAQRLTARARQNVSVSKEAMNLAQQREFDLLKRNVAQRLKNENDPIYGAYSRAGLRSFDELPQNFQNQQYAKLRRSPAFATRVARSARLPLSVLRQYNKARFGLGVGRTNRNKTLRATKGATVGAPAFAKGVKNATLKNTRPWYQKMFSRKPAPSVVSPTLGNAYTAMNTA